MWVTHFKQMCNSNHSKENIKNRTITTIKISILQIFRPSKTFVHMKQKQIEMEVKECIQCIFDSIVHLSRPVLWKCMNPQHIWILTKIIIKKRCWKIKRCTTNAIHSFSQMWKWKCCHFNPSADIWLFLPVFFLFFHFTLCTFDSFWILYIFSFFFFLMTEWIRLDQVFRFSINRNQRAFSVTEREHSKTKEWIKISRTIKQCRRISFLFFVSIFFSYYV